jgi:polysaccharide export outer membrane protein
MRVRIFLAWIATAVAGWPALADTPEPAPGASGDYVLEPGDTVKVQIFQEPDLDRELLVSAEGEIFLPLIGTLVVKGQTVKAVAETVRALYDSKYLVNPQVNITVLKYRDRSVNVIGAVNNPQAVPFPPEQPLTLLDAISRAGGFNRGRPCSLPVPIRTGTPKSSPSTRTRFFPGRPTSGCFRPAM